MDYEEWRVVVKYYYLMGMGYKAIYTEISQRFPQSIISKEFIKKWCGVFKSGDLSCNDKKRAGRPKIDLSANIKEMLEDQPFLSAKYIAAYFDVSPHTIKDILIYDLGLKNM